MQAKNVHQLPAAVAASDRMFVDTNIWKCFTYTKATLPRQAHSVSVYTNFISECVKAKAQLFSSVLSFSELSSIIERTELEIYKNANGTNVPIKKFREGTIERQVVVQEVNVAWQQVEQLSTLIPITLDDHCLASARANFDNYPLDSYDVFFVEQMKAAGLTAIVTDDLDFIYVPGLEVYTCNVDSIGRARLFKRLV